MKYLLLLIGMVCTQAKAQTVDEIITKYTAAMGGLDAFNKVETTKITGTLISQGKSYPMISYIVNGKQMRTEVNVNGQVVINAYDKGKGWKINPFENIVVATEVTAPDDLASLKLQANLANNLMDYKKRGHQVELLGEETVGQDKAYKIRLTSKDDNKVTTYFISTGNFMLLRSDSKQKIQNNEYDAQTFYSDIKEFNGLKFSMHFVRKIQNNVFQEVNYDNIVLNGKVDENLFKMPQ